MNYMGMATSLIVLLVTGGLNCLHLARTGKPLSLMIPFCLIVIPAWLLTSFFFSELFQYFIYFVVHKIGPRFFPNTFRKFSQRLVNEENERVDRLCKQYGIDPVTFNLSFREICELHKEIVTHYISVFYRRRIKDFPGLGTTVDIKPADKAQ
jgi:hypothetical protein